MNDFLNSGRNIHYSSHTFLIINIVSLQFIYFLKLILVQNFIFYFILKFLI
jgi:hypothetical protein